MSSLTTPNQRIHIKTDSGRIIGIVQFENFQIPRLLATVNPQSLKLITDLYGAVYIIDDGSISPKLKAYFTLFEFQNVKYGFRGDYPSPKYIFNKDVLWEDLLLDEIKYTVVPDPNIQIKGTNKSLMYMNQPSPVAMIKQGKRYFSECFEEIPSIALSYVKDNLSMLIYYMANRNTLRDKVSKSRCFNLSLFAEVNSRQRVPKHFPINLAKSLYKKFGSKKVLDPSAGWADRMLGAAAAGVEEYVGVDPNTKLRGLYWSISRYLISKTPTKIAALEDGFLEANLPTNYFDTVLTSPPYWNYEIYSEDDKQSIKQYQRVNDWVDNFMKPYLSKIARCLNNQGVLILRMSDTSAGVYMNELIQHVATRTDLTFQGIIAVDDSADYIFVFSKPNWIPVIFKQHVVNREGNVLKLQQLAEESYFKFVVGKKVYDNYIYYRKEFSSVSLINVLQGHAQVTIIKKNVTKDTYEAENKGATVLINPDPASKAYSMAQNSDSFVLPPFSVEVFKAEYQNIVEKLFKEHVPSNFKGTLYVSNQQTLDALLNIAPIQLAKYNNQNVLPSDLIWV